MRLKHMTEAECATAPRRFRFRGGRMRPWSRFVWLTLTAGTLPTAVAAIFGHLTWTEGIRETWISLIFSFCICALCSLVLPRIARPVLSLPLALKWPALISVIVVLAGAGCALANGTLLLTGLISKSEIWSTYTHSFQISVLVTLAFGLSAFFHEVIVTRLNQATAEIKAREAAAEKLRQAATEARLSSLESRVHPHFLFNTLNSILALIRENPAAAERTVERLAALLRFSLDANESRLVPLSSEVKIVKDYLEIEQVRFGSRLRFKIEIPASLGNVAIPPMSLQTLVENCVKHAVAPSREGASIDVRASAGLRETMVEVVDDGPGFSAVRITRGHGLELLQSRLEGLFGTGASLEIETLTAGGARVAMRIPSATGEPAAFQSDTVGALS